MKNNNLLFLVGAVAVAWFLMNQQKSAASQPKLIKLPTNFNQLTQAQQQEYLARLQNAQSIDGSVYE